MERSVLECNMELEMLHTDYREFYSCGMLHYHTHSYYEISLVLSGDMHILLSDTVHHGSEACLILSPPGAPHCVMHDPNVLYKRLNVSFEESFIKGYDPESEQLLDTLDKKGCVISLSTEKCEELFALAKSIHDSAEMPERRLLLLLMLYRIRGVRGKQNNGPESPPAYITNALNYLHENYQNKLLAEDVAWHLGISRTTLMTGFKKHTGVTLCEYITKFRLQEAVKLMRSGHTQRSAAELCGFSDAGSLIRAFKRYFNTTPNKYIRERM